MVHEVPNRSQAKDAPRPPNFTVGCEDHFSTFGVVCRQADDADDGNAVCKYVFASWFCPRVSAYCHGTNSELGGSSQRFHLLKAQAFHFSPAFLALLLPSAIGSFSHLLGVHRQGLELGM